ncbi:MAG: DUF2085 domain-containing protein [Pyrinomonadaceae bacterium]
MKRPLIVWCVVVSCALVLVSLIVGAPLALASGHYAAARTIYEGFGYVCHQIPERSFQIAGHTFAVCARCTGLYFGFAAGALSLPLVRSLKRTDTPSRVWLFVAAAPTVVDFALSYFGIWANTHLSRSVTGALLGAVCAFYVIPGLVDLSRADWRNFFARKTLEQEGAQALKPATAREDNAPSDYGSPHTRI